MSYIPDTRHKMKIDIYGKQKDELNPYWYKILEGENVDRLSGYDWAVQCLMNSIEDIIDDILEDMDEDQDLQTYEEKKQEIVDRFESVMEGDRDELVVSMIEGMEQEDYDRRFEAVRDLQEDPEDKWEE